MLSIGLSHSDLSASSSIKDISTQSRFDHLSTPFQEARDYPDHTNVFASTSRMSSTPSSSLETTGALPVFVTWDAPRRNPSL
jgi:hypothetical protein